ncbi:MAG: ISAs1 family transposase [Nocardioidaceae bacterium]
MRHSAVAILAVGLAAVLAGARSFTAIGEWGADAGQEVLGEFGVNGLARPDEPTIRRLFARIDADVLDEALGVYLWTRTGLVGSRRIIAIDGKTVRGARTGDEHAPHVVAALDHDAGAVLGQLAVAAQSNEIPCVRELLATFDLAAAVVTLDAMHTQTDTAETITDADGDYVLTIKNNTPTLRSKVKDLPWSDMSAHRHTETGHGRRVTRTIKAVAAPRWIGFTGAAQVRRTVTEKNNKKKTVEVVYLITSADHTAAPPPVLAAWVHGHWRIENRLHWVRDVTFDEDRSQARTGNGPRVMATLRSTAISVLRIDGWNNIASGLRHHARHPDHVIGRGRSS